MATPSNKSEEIEKTITELFGIDRRENIKADVCCMCGAACPRSSFRNEGSYAEYKISGLCQTEQDQIFGVD